MRPIQRIIATGFATAAIASASLPALSGTVWPDVDFEWYANVGKGVNTRDPARTTPIRIEQGQTIEVRDGVIAREPDDLRSRDTVIVPVEPLPADRVLPPQADPQPVNPTLPATGSNRR